MQLPESWAGYACTVGSAPPLHSSLREARVRDMPALPTHTKVRRGTATVPEGRMIFGNQAVRDNLLFGRRSARERLSQGRGQRYRACSRCSRGCRSASISSAARARASTLERKIASAGFGFFERARHGAGR